jgi:hypothetical protein
MRILFYILSVFILLSHTSAQKKRNKENWVQGEIVLPDGRKQAAQFRLFITFNEGILQVKNGEKIESLSPRHVAQFHYYDSAFSRHREFVSVETRFRDRVGSKEVFLELMHEGDTYSVFKRYIPATRVYALVVTTETHYGWGVVTEGILEETLFLHVKDQYAYQVSKKGNKLGSIWNDHDFELDKPVLTEILGRNQFKEMNTYASKNKLNISRINQFIETIKHVDGTAFQYTKDMPKGLKVKG